MAEERTWDGCYGEVVGYSQIDIFLEDFFIAAMEDEKAGTQDRYAAFIWGFPGIGKTAKVKQFAHRPVFWEGQQYDGYRVYDVPIAQFEEMGDLHGMPERCVRVLKGEDFKWCPIEVLDGYLKAGWELDHESGTSTMYAPPDWVPREAGPSILLFDDLNRANGRIINGTMQLMQTYGLLSWRLPPGCVIVMTGNPQDSDFTVSQLDDAILTRQQHVILQEDAKEWCVWAEKEGLDSRGINYILKYEEMLVGPRRTNPRTLAKFFRVIKNLPDISSKEDQKRFVMMASSLLDKDTVASMVTFFERDAELVIEPAAILAGEPWVLEKVKELAKGLRNPETNTVEKRIDLLSITCDRLYAYIVGGKADGSKEQISNFARFTESKWIEEDMRYNLCQRIYRSEAPGTNKWLLGSESLTNVIRALV